MNSFLEDLYFGKINPSDKLIEKPSEHIKLTEELVKNIRILYKFINKDENIEQFEAMNNVLELDINIKEIEKSQKFAEGFILGLRLMSEAFYGLP